MDGPLLFNDLCRWPMMVQKSEPVNRNVEKSRLGLRLKSERERLRMTQTEFGAIGGVGKTTVIAWERGTAFPNGAFLCAAAASGADVLYIVTGKRAAERIDFEESEVLRLYRAATPSVRAAILAALQTAQTSRTPARATGPNEYMTFVQEGAEVGLLHDSAIDGAATEPDLTDPRRKENG